MKRRVISRNDGHFMWPRFFTVHDSLFLRLAVELDQMLEAMIIMQTKCWNL